MFFLDLRINLALLRFASCVVAQRNDGPYEDRHNRVEDSFGLMNHAIKISAGSEPFLPLHHVAKEKRIMESPPTSISKIAGNGADL